MEMTSLWSLAFTARRCSAVVLAQVQMKKNSSLAAGWRPSTVWYVCPRTRRTIVLRSRRFNIEKNKQACTWIQRCLASLSWTKGGSFQVTSQARQQIMASYRVYKGWSCFRLNPSGWLLLDPTYDSANTSSWCPDSVIRRVKKGGMPLGREKDKLQKKEQCSLFEWLILNFIDHCLESSALTYIVCRHPDDLQRVLLCRTTITWRRLINAFLFI